MYHKLKDMKTGTLNCSDIKKFTSNGRYTVDVSLNDFLYHIERYVEKHKLDLNPEFQRGHVWTTDQQIAFIEYLFKGGETQAIRFNHTDWGNFSKPSKMVIVDGLQRTTAIMKFLNNELPIFDGYYFKQCTNIPIIDIKITVNNLKEDDEVINWYIELNEGGTPHTKEEIKKEKKMIKK